MIVCLLHLLYVLGVKTVQDGLGLCEDPVAVNIPELGLTHPAKSIPTSHSETNAANNMTQKSAMAQINPSSIKLEGGFILVDISSPVGSPCSHGTSDCQEGATVALLCSQTSGL